MNIQSLSSVMFTDNQKYAQYKADRAKNVRDKLDYGSKQSMLKDTYNTCLIAGTGLLAFDKIGKKLKDLDKVDRAGIVILYTGVILWLIDIVKNAFMAPHYMDEYDRENKAKLNEALEK